MQKARRAVRRGPKKVIGLPERQLGYCGEGSMPGGGRGVSVRLVGSSRKQIKILVAMGNIKVRCCHIPALLEQKRVSIETLVFQWDSHIPNKSHMAGSSQLEN